MKNQFVNDMGKFVGLFVLALVGLVAIGLLLYGLLGYIDDAQNPHRVLSVLLIMSLPVAYIVGRREGQAHSAGVDRGINIKIGAQRQPAPAKVIAPAPAGAQPSWQSLVPPPVDIRIQQAHDDDLVML
jgi:hypothetical protein